MDVVLSSEVPVIFKHFVRSRFGSNVAVLVAFVRLYISVAFLGDVKSYCLPSHCCLSQKLYVTKILNSAV